MSWASWTTLGIFAGRDGVRTGEAGHVLTGELDVHTTWTEEEGLAHITVQYSGASEWLPLAGSPVACPSEEASRALHDTVIHAIRDGAALPWTRPAPGAPPWRNPAPPDRRPRRQPHGPARARRAPGLSRAVRAPAHGPAARAPAERGPCVASARRVGGH